MKLKLSWWKFENTLRLVIAFRISWKQVFPAKLEQLVICGHLFRISSISLLYRLLEYWYNITRNCCGNLFSKTTSLYHPKVLNKIWKWVFLGVCIILCLHIFKKSVILDCWANGVVFITSTKVSVALSLSNLSKIHHFFETEIFSFSGTH